MDKRANNQWEKSALSYQNYQDYIDRKKDHFKLTFIDLLYVSNFKGGNSTINEPEDSINNKLEDYSAILQEIDLNFKGKKLSDLNNEEIELLVMLVYSIVELTYNETDTKIDGFSVSYLSALLSAYFSNLIPILDRRLLNNLKLVKPSDSDSQKQIKDIKRFYEPLIKKIHQIVKETGETLREVDKRIFSL